MVAVRYLVAVTLALGLAAASAHGQAEPAPADDVVVTYARQAPGTYARSIPVEVTVTIAATGTTFISAMGVFDTLPSGWTFQASDVVSGPPFDIEPSPGDQGQIEFAWITPPQVEGFPVTLTYTTVPPANAFGPAEISGQVLYRQSGPELASNVASTTLTGPSRPPLLEQLGIGEAIAQIVRFVLSIYLAPLLEFFGVSL